MTTPTPFFETGADPALGRRVLLVTYHFAPSFAVGGLRWQKLARFLTARGWGVDVVCLDPSSLDRLDEARLRDLPRGVRVFGIPEETRRPAVARAVDTVWEGLRRVRGLRPTGDAGRGTGVAASEPAVAPRRPASIARADVALHAWDRRSLARAYFALLLYWETGRWARAAVRAAEAILGPEHRVLITSGPPHMVHFHAGALAEQRRLPLVMDMRDPWSLNQRVPNDIATPLYFWIAEQLEARAIRRAALVTSNTEPAARALRALHPDQASKITVVMNGSDDEPLPPPSWPSAFVVAYAGNIYLDRNPRPLFRAAARVVRELALSPEQFVMRFVGTVESFDGMSLHEIARECGVGEFVESGPVLPRAEVLHLLASAALLVLLPQDSDMAIPAKVFEYVRFSAWLLALATPESATGTLLQGTTADVVDPDDEDRIAAVLREHYEAFAAGTRPTAVDHDGRFSRARQAERLLDALDALAGG